MSSQQIIDRPGAELSPAKRAVLEARLKGLSRASGIARRGPVAEAPLSFAQERFWFLDRVGQGGIYNLPFPVRLRGAIDAAALERALGEIVRRHEVLRTTFADVEGVPVQRIAPFGGFTLPVEDLTALPEAERQAAAQARSGEECAARFDLEKGPLFRARLLRVSPDDHLLVLCMHHIVTDGWSLGVFFRELWALYSAFRDGRGSPLADLPVQYADYAAWQREQSGGAAEARQLAWWKEQLAGAPALLELPADRPRPPVPSFAGGTVPVSVPPRTVQRLKELAREEGATPFMVVLAAFQVLLGRYAGTDDVVVGTLVAGRTRNEVQGLIGLFMNTLVLRTVLAGDPAFREVVRRAREAVLGAYDHQDVPFERLVEELQPERSLSHSTLFQVLFQMETLEGSEAGGSNGNGRGALRVEGVGGARDQAKFDLTLDLTASATAITGVLEYSSDLFDRGTARRMMEHLERLLEQVATHPDRRISRLELMGKAERDRVLGWNRTTAHFPADRCIHHLFEE
ncbi:MAG TPA: condensation domain-containing protein, partial [Longimicrobiaceae bacterium]